MKEATKNAVAHYGMGLVLCVLIVAACVGAFQAGKVSVEPPGLICGEYTQANADGSHGCEVLPGYRGALDTAVPANPRAVTEDDDGWDCRVKGNQDCSVIVRGRWYLMDFETGSFGPRDGVMQPDCRVHDDRVCDIQINGDPYGLDFELMEIVAF